MAGKSTFEELKQRVKELEIAETERRRAEEALRESKENLGRVVHECPTRNEI